MSQKWQALHLIKTIKQKLLRPLKAIPVCFFNGQVRFLPQVFIRGEFVGGLDILSQLHDSGELKTLLETR